MIVTIMIMSESHFSVTYVIPNDYLFYNAQATLYIVANVILRALYKNISSILLQQVEEGSSREIVK